MPDRRQFDQFYTKPPVAKSCWRAVIGALKKLRIDAQTCQFIEPSAGCGGFYQFLPHGRRIGIDIAPHKWHGYDNADIITADYLTWQPAREKPSAVRIVIGNPPFGRRGKSAVAFFNHSAFAEVIAFIVPVSFRKFAIHRQLHRDFALIARHPLARDSFHTPDGRDYAINAEFQIWTRLPASPSLPPIPPIINLRETAPAPISHPDFEMRQYNNTRQALPMFDAPFDFAVPCQGWQDYSRRETAAIRCEKNKQWILFTAADAKVRTRLINIDYAALADTCATATPGFRKNDVVRCYARHV